MYCSCPAELSLSGAAWPIGMEYCTKGTLNHSCFHGNKMATKAHATARLCKRAVGAVVLSVLCLRMFCFFFLSKRRDQSILGQEYLRHQSALSPSSGCSWCDFTDLSRSGASESIRDAYAVVFHRSKRRIRLSQDPRPLRQGREQLRLYSG